MKYQKLQKENSGILEAQIFAGTGFIFFAAGILLQFFLLPPADLMENLFCGVGMVFYVLSLIVLFIARHRERKYKLMRAIYKMKGIDIKTGRLNTGGPIHLPYVPGSRQY